MIYKYEEWEPGQPCPKCQSTNILRTVVYKDRVKSKDGKIWETLDDWGYLDMLNESMKKYECAECNTTLYKSPSD